MLIQITDPAHKDYGCVIARWRLAGSACVEYRDGGVWSRLTTSQYRLIDNH